MKLVKLTIWFAVCVSFAFADVAWAQNRRITVRLGPKYPPTPTKVQPRENSETKSDATATDTETGKVDARATYAQKIQQLQEDNRENMEYNRQTVIAQRTLADKKMDLFEYSDWMKGTLDLAEKSISAEAKPFFNACRKMMETGTVSRYCSGAEKSLDVCRAAYTSPFLSKRGRLDDQVRVQDFSVTAYFDFLDAFKEWARIEEITDEQAKLDVLCAISESRGRQYEVDHWKYRFKRSGKAPTYSAPFGQGAFQHLWKVYNKASPEAQSTAKREKEMRTWKNTFAALSEQGKPIALARSLDYVLGGGGTMGHQGYPLPTPDEFKFISRGSVEAYAKLRNPPKELRENTVRFTYWKRGALVLKVQVPNYKYYVGSGSGYYLNNCLSVSFLKGLNPQWRKELVDFQKSLPTEGVSPDVIQAYENGQSLRLRGRSEADQKWFWAMEKKEEELYRKYFAADRLRLREIPEADYTSSKKILDDWLRINPNTEVAYQAALCSAFERLAPTCDNDASSITRPGKYSLSALEAMAGQPIMVGKNR